MNNLLRVLITLVVSLVLTILLCAICVGTIQLLRTLCNKLTRALNGQRPYVVEFSGNGARRLSCESSSDGRYDTNSLDRQDSADIEARHAPRRGGDALDPIWTDTHTRENEGSSRNGGAGSGTSSTPAQNGNGCSSGGGGYDERNLGVSSNAGCGGSGKTVRATSSIQSPTSNCSKLRDVSEKNDRNARDRECPSAAEDDLTIINIWAADDGSSSIQQQQQQRPGPLERKEKGVNTKVLATDRRNVEDIRALV